MLRTTFVLILIGIGLWYSMKGAFWVLLFYLWIAYFRPDAWIWSGWVNDWNLSFIVGAAVIVATLFSGEKIRLGFGQFLMLAFVAHTALSLIYSPALAEGPAGAGLWVPWTDFARKVLMGFLMITLITSEERLRLTLLVIAASLAFEGAKQGWAQLVINPGALNTNPSPFMGDNNGVAVGMLMLIPVLTALSATTTAQWQKYLSRFLIVGVLYRSISTYSRGGFLAAIALLIHYLFRAKKKFRALFAFAVVAAIIYPVLPQSFWTRMSTIQDAAVVEDEEALDFSQRGRLHFWRVGIEMANDRPFLGVGFDAYSLMYDRYDTSYGAYGTKRAVHSAWFGVMAEVGYFGAGIFILLLLRSFYINFKARRLARTRPELSGLVTYATAMEAALLVFVIGGLFVPHQYNEMLWHFIALTMVIERLVHERIDAPAPVPEAAPALTTAIPPSRLNGLTQPMRTRR